MGRFPKERPQADLVHAGPLTQRGKPRQKMARTYSQETIERALTLRAILGTDTLAKAALFDELGIDVPPSTISGWRRNAFAERYSEICAHEVAKIHARIAQDSEEVARKAARAESKAISRTLEQLEDATVRDPSTIARNMATVKAINVDKAALLRNRPTAIVETRDVSEVIAALTRLGVVEDVVEGTADEEPPDLAA